MTLPFSASSASSIPTNPPRRRASVSSRQHPPPPQPMRSSAGFSSIPTSARRADDPFEKPDRHSRHSSSNGPALMGEVRSRMAGSRNRLFRAVVLVALVFALFFMLAPGDRSTTVKSYLPKVGTSDFSSSSKSTMDSTHIDTPTVETEDEVEADDDTTGTTGDDTTGSSTSSSSSSTASDESTTGKTSSGKTSSGKTSSGSSKYGSSKYGSASHGSSHQDSSTTFSDPEDPALATDKCRKPYHKDLPLIQYVLMIDAGSTGSRIHVYRFNNCGATPELEDEIFEQTKSKVKNKGSGLSEYANDPDAAAKSLDPLMAVALENVPESLRGCTPVAVKATAGLRKVGEEKSEAILDAVRERLETEYPFPVVSEDEGGIEVMDGKDEAVYAWITVNYLQQKIGTAKGPPTAAVFDLGGGSTQIVFEPTFMEAPEGGMPQELAKGDHRHELSFGGRDFTLYQHSYLGFGLMAARQNVYWAVIESALGRKPKSSDLTKTFANPCFLPGSTKVVDFEFEEGADPVKVNMTGPPVEGLNDGILNAAQCRAFVEMTMDKYAACKVKPCSFGGVHQPSFSQTFAANDVYLLSYFYDRANPLGMPENFTISELKSLSHDVCAGSQSDDWARFKDVKGAVEDLNDRPESCLDLSFMVTLLHIGYGMPIDREVKIAKKLQGNELGWCLGASLPLLSSDSWSCKLTTDV